MSGPTVRSGDRGFRYTLVAPSIFVLLLIGVFPIIYLLMVSFQGLTMTDNDTSFQGLLNFRALLDDTRLWQSLMHTVFFTAIALPPFVAAMWAMRGMAPTRLVLSGAAAGLLAGAIGAAVYALYCPEMEPVFLGIWYLLGMLVPAAIGAALGRWILRW